MYDGYVKAVSPPSPKIKDFINAFLVGGSICLIGELLLLFYDYIGITEKITKMLVPVTLIFAAALLTGIGIFDKKIKNRFSSEND